MTFIHTFLTWAVANILQIVTWILFGLLQGVMPASFIHDEYFGILFVFSILCSIPCLLLAWPLLVAIVDSRYTRNTKFVLWLCTLVLIIAVVIVVIMIMMNEMSFSFFGFGIPAMIATIITALIRYKQFQRLIDTIHPEEFEHSYIENLEK